MRRLLIILLCALATYTYAQDLKKQGPDLQTIDDGFFDPTRKTEKEKEVYQFSIDYRLEVGYVQNNQRSRNLTYPDMYLHGVRLGANVTFNLPLHFGIQTGLLYTLAYGPNNQHWRSQTIQTAQTEYIQHRVLQHQFVIPVRATYTIPVWRELNLFFYGGPQLQIGLAENDYMKTHLSEPTKQWLEQKNIHTSPYDRLAEKELYRTNIQLGVGGGIEWAQYRLQAGYDFGLNNLARQRFVSDQHVWQWGWYTTFCYRF